MTRLEREPFARRRFLGALAAGTGVGVAGCLGNGGAESEDGGDDHAGDGNDGEHQYATSLEHPGDEPIEFTDDQHCPVCNMTPADYPQWQCQLAHDDGTGAAFDTPGCLFAYYAVPPTDAPVAAAWVTDFETEALVDAFEAHFVVVTDEDAVTGEVMGLNPRPFADRDDAVAYLDEWEAEELTEEDVVSLEDVDREVAAIYRGNRLPDE
ncbi:nitrous oxide reductase accessory protein NosL [Natrarchaeobius oligotrophus]|uniref:NosL family protein n=1 Tax=Natrarchaeobius chitinivorans TaxID=1679083 RepID=A0A3N6MGA9_NATCH|nr:nitrous oxide reductase accessory protein NosL [Natrarchaeobius chitinivorans]RQH03094.1 hypothetical protein EA472_00385 [Natrarchaeobius chitinivorans]